MSEIPVSPVDQFIRRVETSLRTKTFVRLHLSQPAGEIALERVIGRLVEIRGEPKLSLTLREPKRDTTQNLALDAVSAWLADQVPATFRSAVLETTEKNWQLSVSSRGKLLLAGHRPTKVTPPPREHDAAKPVLLDDSARAWLTQLGIVAADGRVRASMADKHRQLERYLEIFSHLARECGWKSGDAITIADMGCGKGYLTFGVWHLLNKIMDVKAQVIGVETRRDLVAKCEAAARAVGAESLRFVAGDIAHVELPRIDALVALHACNTATDDALRRGIVARAKLIVVSPCCHQEVRPQLGSPEPLASLLAHGIFAERMSEWVTDGLRMLHLERAGYATKAIEFVASEHTPRNLLIAAVRRDSSNEADAARAAAQIAHLKDFFGISHQSLDDLLAPPAGA